MFQTIKNYFKKLFVGGPTFQTYKGVELFWPSHSPINSFPINVYLTDSAARELGTRPRDIIEYVNASIGFRAFNLPVLAALQDFRKIFDAAATHKANPNLRGMILIDTEERLNKANTTLYYATAPYPDFREEIGSIRCAFIDMGLMMPTELLNDSLLHELGHTLGLAHDTETGSVMNEWLSLDFNYNFNDKTKNALRAKYAKVAVKP